MVNGIKEVKARLKQFWHHWLLERCETCHIQNQLAVADEVGEDCNLFEKLRDAQIDAAECRCGTKFRYTYRHALADWNAVSCSDKHGDVALRKLPLLNGQERGEFLSYQEYAKRNKEVGLKDAYEV